MKLLEWTEIVGEKSRTYIFIGMNYTVANVVKLCICRGGNHRLEDKDGKKYIVRGEWVSIEIDAEDWSA